MKIAILIMVLLITACAEKEDGYTFSKGKSFVFDDKIVYAVFGEDSNGEWFLLRMEFNTDRYHMIDYGLKVLACTKYGCDEEIFYKPEEK